MVAPSVGSVVLLPFPFTDLSQSKLRPAVVLADAGKGDWILCQVTSNSFADPAAEKITSADFAIGSLKIDSFVRPAKLFTASASLLIREVGKLNKATTSRVIDAVVEVIRP